LGRNSKAMGKVSVILPTRRRVEKLDASLRSLYEKARGEFELLVGVDNDDLETVNYLVKNYPDTKILLVKRMGYSRLHEYVNKLSYMAEGDWLFLWNDDAIMHTKGWDSEIEKQSGFSVFCPRCNQYGYKPSHNNLFPIVPRQWIKLFGYFSLSPQNDSFVQHISNRAEIAKDIAIEIEHRHYSVTGEGLDETASQIQYEEDFHGKYGGILDENARIIRNYLLNEGVIDK